MFLVDLLGPAFMHFGAYEMLILHLTRTHHDTVTAHFIQTLGI